MTTQNTGLQNRISLRQGFTLVEMLLVLVIIGTLAAIVMPQLTKYGEEGRKKAAKAQIHAFDLALDAYEMHVGAYPSTSEGLEALRRPPANAANWQGPYLKNDVPPDPWKRPYVYTEPGEHNPTTYDIRCLGRDGQEGTEDDIGSWALAAN